jgi:hypothetical protein
LKSAAKRFDQDHSRHDQNAACRLLIDVSRRQSLPSGFAEKYGQQDAKQKTKMVEVAEMAQTGAIGEA